MSQTQEVVKSYIIGDSGSLVVVVPKQIRKETNTKAGDFFQVLVGEDKEIIYKPLDLEGK